MDKQLQQVSSQNTLSVKEVDIAVEVYKVNLLVPYPLKDYQIDEWAICINKIYPDLDPNLLNRIFEKMMKDEIQWNPKKGIQNIFIAIRNELDPGYDFRSRL